ncbi:hypothetical protein [Marilutibacter spongiae]|uniref:Uncharacterized protein n=1 Tax=Marilutibacter spongiae TaxID=2025720 RepID=A0A7W3TNU8_9GAMM|nr:hypothetical protein [Lysobacter spongiae]MBB1061773.1 hypothetical protein [Lysobacter spongiae]
MRAFVRSLLPICMLCLAIAGPVCAQTPPGDDPPAVDIEDVDGLQVILEQQRELRAHLDAGGIEGLTTRENNRVRDAQAEVFAITEGKSRLDQLDINEKVALENALQKINAYVQGSAAAADGQTVCWRERVTGSKRKTTRCGTEAERLQARQGARAYLERPKVCGQNCGGQL